MRIDVMIELMHDDLPAPVAPEIKMWGISARSAMTERPAMSRPTRPRAGGWPPWPRRRDKMSPSETSWRLPVGDFDADGRLARDRGEDPHVGRGHGVGDVTARRLVTRATLTPGTGSSSKRVTDGPTVAPTSRVATPWAASAATSTSPASSIWRWSWRNCLVGGR